MSTRLKTISFTFLGFVLGIIVGVMGMVHFIMSDIIKSMFMLQEMEFSRNEDAAIEAYLNEPPEIGIWALQHYINGINQAINHRKSELENAEKTFFFTSPITSLVFAHARLALLYEKKGNDSKKGENASKAFEYAKLANIMFATSEEKILQFVIKLDENHKSLK